MTDRYAPGFLAPAYDLEDVAPARNRLHILLVGSDPDGAAAVSQLLQSCGYRVLAAPDTSPALGRARSRPPDVALLGADLSETDAQEVVRGLHEQKETVGKRPFLISLGGKWTSADSLQSPESGIDLRMEKPVDLEFLQRLLRRFERIILPDEEPTGELAYAEGEGRPMTRVDA
jgi:CheY-like chemotaxis protein